MQGQYSLRSPAVKRLMREAQELCEPTAQFHAQPLEDNLFEWHFTIRGPDGTDFEGGVYHGRIILPPEYPMKPPSIIILTANGRFEINAKICLSISGHHPESWQPSWSIRTALLAIIGFMPTHGSGAIGSLDYTTDEKKRLARKSQDYKCPQCGATKAILRPVSETSQADTEEAKELASQINFQGEKKDANKDSDSTSVSTSSPSPAPVSSSSSATPPTAPSQQFPGAWPPYAAPPGPGAMPRLPFMPFMRPPMTSGATMPTNSPPMPAGVNLSPQMAAVHAAMLQHMRAQRFRFAAFAGQPNTEPSPSHPSPAQPEVNSESPAMPSPTTSTSGAQSEAAVSQGTSSVPGSAVTPQATSATSEGVRHRTTAGNAAPRTGRVTATSQPAELRRRARQQSTSSSVVTNVLIVILAVAFFTLLLRRLSLMGYVTFNQDADI